MEGVQFLISFALLAASCNGAPEMMLKNIKSPANSTYVAITSVPSDNQLCLPPGIKASEVCVKKGIWIFYTGTGFNSTTPASTMIYTRNDTDPAMTCYDLPPTLDKAIGSYRLAGDLLDETRPAINVYVGTEYTATELMANHSLIEVPFAFNSAIISGPERWEFFMKEGFEGFSECTNADEKYVPDFTARFGVQSGDIKSIRINCSKPKTKLNPNHIFKGYALRFNNRNTMYY